MTERMLRLSHGVVRVTATITLSYIGIGVVCEGYFSTHCRALANSPLGRVMTFWTIATSLLLPLYVGFEGWWMRKSKVAGKALWVDAAFAIACFLSFWGMVLYAFGRYAMF